MYLSSKSESTEELFKDVSHSFARELNNNKKIDEKINILFKITDSIQQHNTKLILKFQKRIANNSVKFNNTVQRMIVCNVLFLILVLVLYVKRK